MKRNIALIVLFACFLAGGSAFARRHVAARKHHVVTKKGKHSPKLSTVLPEPTATTAYPVSDIVSPDNLIQFAQTLIGTPYREASSNPLYGFDCSGFVSYVFKNFDLKVPRSSQEFYNAGERIALAEAKPGDVILFTGTKTHHPHSIGHVGIVYSYDTEGIRFIHSTSGKENGVTISEFNDTYKRRFVQVVRLLTGNNQQPTEKVTETAVVASVGK